MMKRTFFSFFLVLGSLLGCFGAVASPILQITPTATQVTVSAGSNATLTYQLQNNASATLANLTYLTPPSTQITSNSTCGSSLAPNASCNLVLSFSAPAQTGNLPLSLTVCAFSDKICSTVNAQNRVIVTITPASSNVEKIYVANQGANTVSVINAATEEVIATVNVGTAPFLPSATPDGKKVYITNKNSNNVSVIDTTTDTVLTTISVGAGPQGIAVSPDGSKVYVINGDDASLSVISTATDTVTQTVALSGVNQRDVIFSPDGSRAYVAAREPSAVIIFNAVTNTVIGSINLADDSNPAGFAITPDGALLYVTSPVYSALYIINTATNTVTGTIAATPAFFATMNLAGTRMYVTSGPGGNIVSTVNTATNNVTDTIGVNFAVDAGLNQAQTRLYVTSRTDGTVSVIDPSTNTIINTITVGIQPSGLAVSPPPS